MKRLIALAPLGFFLIAGCDNGRALELTVSAPATDAGIADASHDLGLDLAQPPMEPVDMAMVGLGRDLGGYAAPHPPLPQVITQGGAMLAAPSVTVVYYAGDSLSTSLVGMVNQLAGSTYWKETSAEYGVGALTVRPPVVIADKPPNLASDKAIQVWLAGKIDQKAPGFGTPDANSVYVIYYPAGVTVTIGAATGCVDFEGYHNSTALISGKQVAYAVLPRCGGAGGLSAVNTLSVSTSHELLEAATDAQPNIAPAYLSCDAGNLGWQAVIGASEIGDLCEFNNDFATRPSGFTFSVQRTWSDVAARASHDPCVPADNTLPYFNAAPVLVDTVAVGGVTTKGIALPVGASKTIELDLFSDGPTGAWNLSTQSTPRSSGLLQTKFDRVTGVNGDKVQLTVTVPFGARPGDDSFFIRSVLAGHAHTWPVAVQIL